MVYLARLVITGLRRWPSDAGGSAAFQRRRRALVSEVTRSLRPWAVVAAAAEEPTLASGKCANEAASHHRQRHGGKCANEAWNEAAKRSLRESHACDCDWDFIQGNTHLELLPSPSLRVLSTAKWAHFNPRTAGWRCRERSSRENSHDNAPATPGWRKPVGAEGRPPSRLLLLDGRRVR